MTHSILVLPVPDNSRPERLNFLSSWFSITVLLTPQAVLEQLHCSHPEALIIQLKRSNTGFDTPLKPLLEQCEERLIPVWILTVEHIAGQATSWPLSVSGILYESDDPERNRHDLEYGLATYQKMMGAIHENRSLNRQLIIKTVQLTESEAEIVNRLSKAAEQRDPETGDHIHRMSHYCYLLATHCGFSDSQCRLLLNASPMHDIGKLGIPDIILLTPGQLSVAEWEIMKQHTTIGAGILADSRSELIQLGYTIALTHHEKWDGSGYPNQLAGESIPIWGRIAALADVFDAMTTKRVYQDPVPLDKAFEYISSQKGKHFDPKLAGIFLSLKSEIQGIRKTFSK